MDYGGKKMAKLIIKNCVMNHQVMKVTVMMMKIFYYNSLNFILRNLLTKNIKLIISYVSINVIVTKFDLSALKLKN